jgi:hypothetical protein
MFTYHRLNSWFIALLTLVSSVSLGQEDIQLFIEIYPNYPVSVVITEYNDDGDVENTTTIDVDALQHAVYENSLSIHRVQLNTHSHYKIDVYRLPNPILSTIAGDLDTWVWSDLTYNNWCHDCDSDGNDAWESALDEAIWGYNNGNLVTPSWAVRAFFSLPDDDVLHDPHDDFAAEYYTNDEILHKGLPDTWSADDYLELWRVGSEQFEGINLSAPVLIASKEFSLDFDLKTGGQLPLKLDNSVASFGFNSGVEQIVNQHGNLKTNLILPLVRGGWKDEPTHLQSNRKWLADAEFTYSYNSAPLHSQPIEMASGSGYISTDAASGLDTSQFISVPTRDAHFEYAADLYYNNIDVLQQYYEMKKEFLDHKRPVLYGLVPPSDDHFDRWRLSWDRAKNHFGELVAYNTREEAANLNHTWYDWNQKFVNYQLSTGKSYDDDAHLNMYQITPHTEDHDQGFRWGYLNTPAVVEYQTYNMTGPIQFAPGMFMPPTYYEYQLQTVLSDNLYDNFAYDANLSAFNWHPEFNPTAGFPMWERQDHCDDDYDDFLGDDNEKAAGVNHWYDNSQEWFDHECNPDDDYLHQNDAYFETTAMVYDEVGVISTSTWLNWGGTFAENGSHDHNCVVEWTPEKNPMGSREYRMFSPTDVIGLSADELTNASDWENQQISESQNISDFEVLTYQVETTGSGESTIYPAKEYQGNRQPFGNITLGVPYNLEWVTLDPANLELSATMGFQGGTSNQSWGILNGSSDDSYTKDFSSPENFPWAIGPIPDISSENDEWSTSPLSVIGNWNPYTIWNRENAHDLDVTIDSYTATDLGNVTFTYRDSTAISHGALHYSELKYQITQTSPQSLSPPQLSNVNYGGVADANSGGEMKIKDDTDINTYSPKGQSVGDRPDLNNDNMMHIHNFWVYNTSTSSWSHRHETTFEWEIPLQKFFDNGFVPGATVSWDGIQLVSSHRGNSTRYQQGVTFDLPELPLLELTETSGQESWLNVSFDVTSPNFPSDYDSRIGYEIHQVNTTDTVLVFSSENESISDLSTCSFTPDFTMLNGSGQGEFIITTKGISEWANSPSKQNPQIFNASILDVSAPVLEPPLAVQCMNVGVFVQWTDPSNDDANPPISEDDWYIKLERRKVCESCGAGAETPWITVNQGISGLSYNDNLSSVEATTDWSLYSLEYRLISRLEIGDIHFPWDTTGQFAVDPDGNPTFAPLPVLIAPNQAQQLTLDAVTYSPSVGVTLTWDDLGLWPVSIQSITIEESLGSGWNEVAAQVTLPPGTTDHYVLDDNLSPCEPVSYRIISNGCEFDSSPSNAVSITIQPEGASEMWNAADMLVATQDMGTAVQIDWGEDFAALIDHYEVRRYNVDESVGQTCPDWSDVDGLAGWSGRDVTTTTLIDNNPLYGAAPNQLYEYEVVAHFDDLCNQADVTSNRVVGFRVANGTVSGRITYEADGAASPGVRVDVSPVDEDKIAEGSLILNSTDGNAVSVPRPSSDSWSAGWWMTTDTDIDELNVATVEVNGAGAELSILFREIYQPEGDTVIRYSQAGMIRPNGDTVWSSDDPVILPDSLGDTDFIGIHYADASWYLVFDDTTLFAGERSIPDDDVNLKILADNGSYTFGVDEIRLFEAPEADSILLSSRDKVLNGIDENLFAYYPCNERSNVTLYDLSGSTNINLNQRSGTVEGPCPWSNDGLINGPTTYAITDLEGYYTVEGIRYKPFAPADNFTFEVVPTRGVDNFVNTSEQVTISDAVPFSTNVNFLNTSSYGAKIRVLNRNPQSEDKEILSDCGVSGAKILIDGEVVMGPDGAPILTGSDGYSDSFQVPAGWHYISAQKDGHDFVIAQYGSSSSDLTYNAADADYFYYDFREHDAVFNFVDLSSTFVKGRIVGGQMNAMLPWGESVNNIGKAHFTLRAGSVDAQRIGCPTYSIVTDVETGEWSAHVPPLPFAIVDVNVPSAETYDSNWGGSALEVWCENMDINLPFDRSQNFESLALPDSIWAADDPGDANPWYLPMVFKDDDPTIEVFNEFGGLEMGELEYQFRYDTAEYAVAMYDGLEEGYPIMGQKTALQPKLGNPLFVALRPYPLAIEWKEYYTNYDPLLEDDQASPEKYAYDVYDPSAVVTITDDLSYLNGQSASMVWSPHETLYTIQPCVGTNTGGDFLRAFSIQIESANSGIVSQWPEDGNGMNAYVTGQWTATGSTFTNAGPVVVEMILRDPPGDASSTTWNSETTLIKESFLNEENEFQEGGGKLEASLGLKTEVTIPYVGTHVKVEVGNEIGGEVGRFGRQTSEVSISEMITNETAISTNDDGTNDGFAELSHHTADVFIGTSKAVAFSPSLILDLAPIETAADNPNLTLHGSSTLLANDAYGNQIQVQLATTKSVKLNPMTDGGTSNMFVFTNTHIENNVIPDLQLIRNNMIGSSDETLKRYRRLTNDELQAYFLSQSAYYQGTFQIDVTNSLVMDSLVTAFDQHYPEIVGWNNDDPRLISLGIAPSSIDYWEDSYITDGGETQYLDRNGPVYVMDESQAREDVSLPYSTPAGQHLDDEVRDLNQSIRLWQEALAKNEMEKFLARKLLEGGLGDGDVFFPGLDPATDPDDFESYNLWSNGESDQPMVLSISGFTSFEFSTGSSETRNEAHSIEYKFNTEMANEMGVKVNNIGASFGSSYTAEVTTMRPTLTPSQCEALQDLDNMPGPVLNMAVAAAQPIIQTASVAVDAVEGISQGICDAGIAIQDGVTGVINSMGDLIDAGYTASGVGTSPELNYLVENGFYLETIAEAASGTVVGLTAATLDFGVQSVQAYAEGYIDYDSYMVDLIGDYLPPGGVAELINPFCYVDEIGDALDAFSNAADLPQLPWISECNTSTPDGDPSVAELAELMQAYGEDWGNVAYESQTENTFSFYIDDSDAIDSYLLAVVPGKGSNSPVFLNLAGESMCPWYNGLNSAYEEFYLYKDVISFANGNEQSQVTNALQATTLTEFMVEKWQSRRNALANSESIPSTSLLIEEAHLRHEVPSVTVNGLSSVEVFGVESDEQAVVTLQLDNNSESGMDIIYDLRVAQASNPDGAILMIDGFAINDAYAIPYNGGIEKTVTIDAGPSSFVHDSLAIVFASQCQSDPTDYLVPEIADTAWVSVNFIPVCTDVTIGIGGDNDEVINMSDVNVDTGAPNIDFIISNYNINYPRLETVRLQSRLQGESDWNTIQLWTLDPDDVPSEIEAAGNWAYFPTANSNIVFSWDPTAAGGFGVGEGLLPTGQWDIRVVSGCLNDVETFSTPVQVELDLDPPSLFGLPEPSDGILELGEEVSASFNQSLDPATIGGFSAVISGVLNADPDANNYELSRFSSGYGIESEGQFIQLEDASSLSQQPFSISMWFNLNELATGATGDRVLMHQGPVDASKFEIGIDSENFVYAEFGHTRITKNAQEVPTNTWCFLGISVDPTSEIVFKLMAEGVEDLGSTALTGELAISAADFDTDGSLFFGNSANLDKPMNGVIREIRVWDDFMTGTQLAIDRSTPLFARTAGLRSWIPLRELDGVPEEWSRGHQVIAAGDWRSLPPGYSADLTGENAGLVLNGGAISDDWTFELWVHADASMPFGEHAIWTKGNWEAEGGQGLYWIHDATTGQYRMEFKSQGEILSSVEDNVNPGDWIHVAIARKLNGIVRFMINGQIQATFDSQLCSPWTTVPLTVGSDADAGVSGFKGYVDEIRLWHAVRTPQQIQDHLRERLNFDLQVGLNLHVPFEMASVDANSGLVTSSEDSIAYRWNLVLTEEPITFNGDATFSTQAPLIELIPQPREILGISITLSANQDELQFVMPESDSWKTEETRVSVALRDIITDENGNSMSPGTEWDFYVRQNPLRWMEDELNWQTLPNISQDTTLHLVNLGGEFEMFTIERIPPWLVFEETEGIVPPLSTKEISVQLAPGLSIGHFEWDIALRGNMGYPERLTSNIDCAVSPPDIAIDLDGYPSMTSIIGHVLVDGVISHHEEDFVVGYINDEPRAVSPVSAFNGAEGDFLVFLSIPHSFDEATNGAEVEFRIWDASRGTLNSAVDFLNHEGTESDWTSATGGLILNDDQQIFGTLVAPMQFAADDRIVQQTTLHPGWNWLSFYVESDSLLTLESTFPEADGSSIIDEIKDHQGGSVAVQAGGQWAFNSSMLPLTLTSRYLVHVTGSEYTLDLQGRIPDLSSHTETIYEGWNGLGYPGFRTTNLDLALSDLVNLNGVQFGDVIQSQNAGFAMLSPGGYWIGSLEVMEPGEGYRLFVQDLDNSISFEYPSAIISSGGYLRSAQPQNHPWVNSVDLETKHVSAVLVECEIPGGIEAGDAVAAFVDGKCIGAVQVNILDGEENRFFLNLNHDETHMNPVQFVLYKASDDLYTVAEEMLKVTADALHGSWNAPFVLHFNYPNAGLDLNTESFSGNVFASPNPTNGTTRISGLEPLENVSWNLLDARGRNVMGQEVETSADGSFTIDMSHQEDGLYIMNIAHDAGTSTLRIIKSK